MSLFLFRYWRPFLTLPRDELRVLPDQANPTTEWRELPWPLRGTVFPFVALPLVLALIAFLVAGVGKRLWAVREVIEIVASISLISLWLLLAGLAIMTLCRQLRGLAERR